MKKILKKKKIAKIILRYIYIFFNKHFQKNIGVLTITKVEINDNFSFSKIYLLGINMNIVNELNVLSYKIVCYISHFVKIKNLPKLIFIYDFNSDKVFKIFDLIDLTLEKK